MQVHVGVLVPDDVVAPVAALVASASVPPAAAVEPARRTLFRRARTAAPAPPAQQVHVVAVPADQVHVSIATFGNLPTGDVQRLGDVLEEAASAWRAPWVQVAGVDAQEQSGVVAVALAGEVDELREVARGVTGAVERLGLFVDRRRFRPAAVVGLVDGEGDDAAEALDRVRAAVAAYRGEPWRVAHLSLLKVEHDAGARRLVELRRLPLGGTR